MAAIYQRNKPEILHHLAEINRLTGELRSVFFGSLGSSLFNFPGCEYGDTTLERLERQFKRDAWSAMLNKLDLRKFMSSSKQKELDQILTGPRNQWDPDPIDAFPDVTESNIMDVMQGYISVLPDFMDEAIREEWAYWLPKRDAYRTNAERWKVSRKIIMQWVMRRWDKWDTCHRVRYDAAKHVNNLDSIFHLLDGKGFPKEYNSPLYNALEGDSDGVGETEYFRFKCFKNGNLHLTVKRLDLLDKFNEIGCGHGSALPNPTERGYTPPPPSSLEGPPPAADQFASLDFFETPEPVCRRMLDIIDAHHNSDDYRRLHCLEPSAGSGAILRPLLDRNPGRLYAFELEPSRAKQLEAANKHSCRLCLERQDFLAVEPFPGMDVVAMNPPFSQGRDMWHVFHATKFLNRTGILVAVMSPHWTFANDKLSESFRRFLETVDFTWEQLPDRSFKCSGTDVSAGLMVIRRRQPTNQASLLN